jgi:hypothetical protein
VSSNPGHGEVYSILHYAIKFVSGLRGDDGDGKFKARNRRKIEATDLKKLAPQQRSRYLAVCNLLAFLLFNSHKDVEIFFIRISYMLIYFT